MGKLYLEAAEEAQRRDLIAIYRRKYVAGSATLKQFAIRRHRRVCGCALAAHHVLHFFAERS
jgi:hypothetical protein